MILLAEMFMVSVSWRLCINIYAWQAMST